jgi:restriction system protein
MPRQARIDAPGALHHIIIRWGFWIRGRTIGRPEIQKFTGSLESKHAKKGVFITTSNFTSEAQDYVQMIEKKIVLIDGKRLSELMIIYDVGVGSLKTYKLKQVDNDYFITI